jgi:heterodisulfide reductase subunit A
MQNKTVAIIGGGIAGMQAASVLNRMNYNILLIEKKDKLGGHVGEWTYLFPTLRPAIEVSSNIIKEIKDKKIDIKLNTLVKNIEKDKKNFRIILSDESTITADAVLLSTGFDLFDASIKEEYGYGIYKNVITQADLEKIFAKPTKISNPCGKIPSRIGFVHCVGSRDEKSGNLYCSKLCCVTAVKQAIELKKHLPESEIFCFYMDMRMGGPLYEELYLEAQLKYGIHFIRGRVSEASEKIDNSVQLKVEDTLTGRPLKMTVDMLVLMAGMVMSETGKQLVKSANIKLSESGFIATQDMHIKNNLSSMPGIFVAGTINSPMSISETLADAKSAAFEIIKYLEESN